MGNNRRAGDYFERQTMRTLGHLGFLVIRSAGSFGVADLVALRDGERPLLVQCKVNARRFTRAERAELAEVAHAAGARAVLAARLKPGCVDLYAIHHQPLGDLTHLEQLHAPPTRPDPRTERT